MELKQKAKELVDRFIPFTDGMTRTEEVENAKQCALICVDEMIRVFKLEEASQELIEWWKEVKQEIEKL